MKTQNAIKLKNAINEAATKLENAKPSKNDPPALGDLFVLPNLNDSVGIFWLFTNTNTDDPEVVLIVPVDMAPFVGTCDCPSKEDPIYVARPQLSAWVLTSRLEIQYRVSYGFENLAKDCRQFLAKMVRGTMPQASHAQLTMEADPNYEQHCDAVSAVVEQL